MKTNFWETLKRPFSALAPMGGVTTSCFRDMLARYAKPDVLFTEFVNVESLFSNGKDAEMKRLLFTDIQHPVVTQLWGNEPEQFYQAAQLVMKLGFDGVDINMGCSIRKILSRNAGGNLIDQPYLAKGIVEATVAGASTIPVSIKTRLGIDAYSQTWFELLLSLPIAALTVHGRTVKAGYRGRADWSKIGEIVRLRNNLKSNVLIIGNGDVQSLKEGIKHSQTYGTEGFMSGRAILKNFWMFEKKSQKRPSFQKILFEHIDCAIEENGPEASADSMRKYYKIYLRSFEGASVIRHRLMNAKSLQECKEIVADMHLN